ncbi:hypothetical protein JMJ77_0008496 [Colletotrichum scovillei]|uniref:Uncharacterized protein n=1 Tax=Colletotrichum scovillei TaxID=1209932 RepID=A0A9P7REW5_9PEZI|nr:hypothetical protein JMJ77_0008496 [Colletotrichum scovillei]KAG7075492.1 hypothetical protein JMJ76_0011952 [Colletotrichum scovillei]KAG7082643.1 hypothetical protein JMJ78_0004744 [Colletotrichum scovillei]
MISLSNFAVLSHRLSLHSCLVSHKPRPEPSQPTFSLFLGVRTATDNDDLELPSPCRHRRELHCLHLSPKSARHPASQGVFPREARPSSGGSAESHSPGRGT